MIASVLATTGVLALPPGTTPPWVLIEYVNIYAIILGIFLLTFDWREYAGVRWLSEATYPIYLTAVRFVIC